MKEIQHGNFFQKKNKTNEMVAKFFAKTMQGAKKTSLRMSHTKLIGRGGVCRVSCNEIYVHDNVWRRMGKASNPLIGGGREGAILKMRDMTPLLLHPRPLMLGIRRPPVILGFLKNRQK